MNQKNDRRREKAQRVERNILEFYRLNPKAVPDGSFVMNFAVKLLDSERKRRKKATR